MWFQLFSVPATLILYCRAGNFTNIIIPAVNDAYLSIYAQMIGGHCMTAWPYM